MSGLIKVCNPVSPPSVYFSEVYGKADAAQTGHKWLSLSDEEGYWQVPLLIRDFEGKAIDATTPYGYGGIYASRELSEKDIADRWNDTKELLEELEVVSVFFRSAPFLDAPRLTELQLEGLSARAISETFAVETSNEEDAWKCLKGAVRTAVRKAHASGLSCEISDVPADLATESHPFRGLYQATMERLTASEQYFFTNEYFKHLIALGSEGLKVAEVRDSYGLSVAAALILLDGQGTVHYHLSGSQPDAARMGANNLLLWEIIRWASANGFRQFHLGGGVRPGDGLEKFKRSFGGKPLPFEVANLIVHPTRYEELADERNTHGEPGQFFPAYRRPQ